MRATELRALAALAEARKGRDLARLEALAAEARGIEAEIAALSTTHARDMAEDPASIFMLGRRLAWAEAEIKARQRRLAAIEAERAAARAAARVSLGKHEALAALVTRAAAAERAAREQADEVARLVAPPAGGLLDRGRGPSRGR